MNYTLNFLKQLGDRELAGRGGELGPLETVRIDLGLNLETNMEM